MKYYVEGHITHYFCTVIEAATEEEAEEAAKELAEKDGIEGMDIEVEIDGVSDAAVLF